MNENKKIVSENKSADNNPSLPGENLRIQICKQNIGQAINNAHLPVGVSLMILNEFVRLLQAQNFQSIAAERKAYEESTKEGAKNGKEIH